MSKWFKMSLVGLLVFGAVAVLISGIAFAQDDTTPAPETTLPNPGGRLFGRGLGGQVGLDAAAGALGMTAEELSAELWAGKTLADVAEEKGVDLVELQATVQAAVQAEMQANMREMIDQAVQNGTITQENADWLLEGLDNGFIPGFGFGHGFGHGGRGGMRGGGFPGGGGFFAPPGEAPQVSPSGGA
jgi:hypothetical protein